MFISLCFTKKGQMGNFLTFLRLERKRFAGDHSPDDVDHRDVELLLHQGFLLPRAHQVLHQSFCLLLWQFKMSCAGPKPGHLNWLLGLPAKSELSEIAQNKSEEKDCFCLLQKFCEFCNFPLTLSFYQFFLSNSPPLFFPDRGVVRVNYSQRFAPRFHLKAHLWPDPQSAVKQEIKFWFSPSPPCSLLSPQQIPQQWCFITLWW